MEHNSFASLHSPAVRSVRRCNARRVANSSALHGAARQTCLQSLAQATESTGYGAARGPFTLFAPLHGPHSFSVPCCYDATKVHKQHVTTPQRPPVPAFWHTNDIKSPIIVHPHRVNADSPGPRGPAAHATLRVPRARGSKPACVGTVGQAALRSSSSSNERETYAIRAPHTLGTRHTGYWILDITLEGANTGS